MNEVLARWRATGLRTRTLLLLGLSTLFLLGMAGAQQIRRTTGDEIVLRTRPVDPRDLLRGAYVRLDYEIERVHLPDLPTPADPADWKEGDTLFLTLRSDGVAWRPVALGRQRRIIDQGDVALRAKYQRREDFADVTAPGKNMPVDILLDIGVEHYYADEKEALNLERDARETPLDVILSVGGDGTPVIKGLVVNGEKRYETLL